MAGNITDDADDAADALSEAGRRAGGQVRRAGRSAGDAIDDAGRSGAASVRRGARKGARAYEAAADEVELRAGSLEDTIRENPLAAAGAALLIGVVLGRFVL